MPGWTLHDIAGQADSAAIMLRSRCSKTGRPFWVLYRVRRVQSLSDALTLAALCLGGGILAGFGLAIGWAWASSWLASCS